MPRPYPPEFRQRALDAKGTYHGYLCDKGRFTRLDPRGAADVPNFATCRGASTTRARSWAELTPGGMRRELTVGKAEALPARIRQADDVVGSGCSPPATTWQASGRWMPG
jgi:hypothetical protein